MIILLVKWNQKYKLLLLECSLMVQTKRNQEKVVVTKICFYGKIKWKMKVGDTKMQHNCSEKREIRKKKVTTKISL